MWFQFEKDFDYRVPTKAGVTIAYKAGMLLNVTRTCAAQAAAKGRGAIVKKDGANDVSE